MEMTKLKFIRLKKGLTQLDVYLRTGIPQWRVSLIERGLQPNKDEAKKIASVLEGNAQELFSKMEV